MLLPGPDREWLNKLHIDFRNQRFVYIEKCREMIYNTQFTIQITCLNNKNGRCGLYHMCIESVSNIEYAQTRFSKLTIEANLHGLK